MHSVTIEQLGDGSLKVACSCGVELGVAQSQLTAEAAKLAHVAGSTEPPPAELSPAIEAIKAAADRKASGLINDMPPWTTWTYEVMHGVIAAAYALGNADGYRECMELVTAPYTPDPRD